LRIAGLHNATPAQLVAALRNDNLFWRLTAQRLLVERGKTDVVPALVRLAEDQSVDDLGLNVGALHALWTLHGLAALAGDAAALRAARNALSHPAASIRRAAIMILPRNQQLLDDIFAAGILPDRRSPWPVDYTVGTQILQDADAHVRLEALLAVAEVGGSDREVAALMDIFTHPGNMRDPWMPDAVGIAGVKLGPMFLGNAIAARAPTDTIALAGMRRAIAKVGRGLTAPKNLDVVVELISAAALSPTFGVALANGVAEGWALDSAAAPIQFSAKQKAQLVAAANTASPELNEAFARIAARWNLPNAFKPE
jgi:hypothetical protein